MNKRCPNCGLLFEENGFCMLCGARMKSVHSINGVKYQNMRGFVRSVVELNQEVLIWLAE